MNIFRLIKKYGLFKLIAIIFYEYWFDFYHRVQTRQFKYHVLGDADVLKDVTSYQPSNKVYLEMLWKTLPVPITQTCLLDIGCGKGRVLIDALLHGVPKMIGIDIDELLLEVARNNIIKIKKRASISAKVNIIKENAALYSIPLAVNVIVIFNPFVGNTLLQFIAKVSRVKQRPMYVYYFNQPSDYEIPWEKLKQLTKNSYLYKVN